MNEVALSYVAARSTMLARYVLEAETNDEPLVITRDGKPVAVVISAETWDLLKDGLT